MIIKLELDIKEHLFEGLTDAQATLVKSKLPDTLLDYVTNELDMCIDELINNIVLDEE